MLVSHTVDGVQHGGEVSTSFETRLLILTLFLSAVLSKTFFEVQFP